MKRLALALIILAGCAAGTTAADTKNEGFNFNENNLTVVEIPVKGRNLTCLFNTYHLTVNSCNWDAYNRSES